MAVSRLGVHKVEPISLVAILELAEVLPVCPHNFLVVVLNERFEDFRLLGVASVYLGEKCIDQ